MNTFSNKMYGLNGVIRMNELLKNKEGYWKKQIKFVNKFYN